MQPSPETPFQIPHPGSAEARTLAIADYQLGDSHPEAEFDHVVELAATLFGVSAAMISIVDRDIQHFKARVGIDACSIDPGISFCVHALDRDEALVVDDAMLDARFADNPLVTGAPHVRFYAGAPLRVASGDVVGTLCVIAPEARRFSGHDRHLLQSLAKVVVDRMELRRKERLCARQEHELRKLAHYDSLTGLPNRTSLHDRAAAVLATGEPIAILLFDLDGFKDVNDVFGHGTGDGLLRAIGMRLGAMLDEGQLLARLGGDEFVVLAPGLGDPRKAWRLADRFRSAFEESFPVDGQDLRLDTCLGVAVSPYHGDTVEKLLCHADLALYRAKESGGGAIAFYEPHLRREVENRQLLQHELRHALDRGEFELFYQPQVRLADGAVVGAEALLRWRHPVHGLLPPSRFLDVLELMPLASAVGEWVLDNAIAQAARWAANGNPLRVGINLFASQFRTGSMSDQLSASLERHCLPAHLIEVELTETIAVKRIRGVTQTLAALRKRGVGIALDDFGTGYASLSLLRDFPVTRLKIDRGFVAEISGPSDRSPLVESVLTLGRAFGLAVVAEGVETKMQANWLRSRGCAEAQGWLFGRPVPAAEFHVGTTAGARAA
jgi:diguanylate cyclase (GGDEF)-like protein